MSEKRIENALITSVDLTMADHGVLTMYIGLRGADGWECCIGGYVLGKGYVGAKTFEGSPNGIEEIMRVMDVVGVAEFSQLVGKYIRVEKGDWGDPIKKIGNILENKWFDYEEFYGQK